MGLSLCGWCGQPGSKILPRAFWPSSIFGPEIKGEKNYELYSRETSSLAFKQLHTFVINNVNNRASTDQIQTTHQSNH